MRKPKASRDVRAWMAKNGIQAKELATEAGYKPGSGIITRFINGERTSQPIRDLFKLKGCPERLLVGLDKLRERKRR